MRYKKIKTLLKGLACLAVVIALSRFCHHATQGFRLTKIASNLIDQVPVEACPDDQALLQELLTQKFHYLGRGLQSFVFASEDGRYVVKIFNNRYQRKIQFYSFLSYIPFCTSWARERVQYFERKLKRTFESYRIAREEMAERTGLLYTHLVPTTNLPTQLQLVDRLNISHTIDPNKSGFLVQRRATLVYPALGQLLGKHDIDSARTALDSLVSLFFWKWRHGIADNDPLIRTNYAILDGKAIQIDVGPLSKETLPYTQERCRTEIQRVTASLKIWLNKNGPELLPFLEESLDRELNHSVSFEE